nr:hypothetical protein [Frisingicoccus sp.]
MGDCVREKTSKELIEESNLDNKDLILSRMKEEDYRNHSIIERYETTISEQRYLLEAYRTVMSDMIYSNWLNKR